jgi:hypothetical protein
MAFNTKIDLYDSKVIQCANQTLTLSGKTVIATSGDLRYQTHPTFTGATQIVDKCYVDTATGGICANNGLTKRGSFITLGGALTGDTTIGSSTCALKINVNTLSLSGNTAFNLSTGNGVITDTGNKGGLQYATCYDACVVKLSIPNAGWVTGKTSTSGIQTAGNGLTKTLTNVTLGGTISGATVITDSRGAGLTLGIQYGGDYSCGYNARSLVDAGYVTGKTSTSGIQTVNNGLTKHGTNAVLGGALTGDTTIGSGSCVLGVNVNTVNLCGCVTLKSTPPNLVADILTRNTSTGEISKTTLSSLGGLTGATNGIGITGQKVCLGGALIAGTSITGAQALCLGTAASKLASLDLRPAGALTIVAGTLPISSSGATFTDLCTIPHGIQYGGDYSTSFCGNSLVSKIYVDSVATGLHVKAAAIVATTAPITLSGNQTIDGVLTTTGMRVLVKNQADATTNGIYSANTGSWGRTSDYINNTQVTNGDLIPVTSGSTQNSSIWALITPDPIIVGVTSLDYTEFSTIIDVQGGQGICITQVGGTHTVCVNPVSGCGLCVDPSGLCINNSIGGNGLTYSGGVINANACSCGAVAAINVGYNGSDNLIVACSDITNMSAIVTGAINGLTKTGQNIGLGGTLTGSTVITDSRVTPLGIQYAADYTTTFVNESLITKRYVHSYVTGGTTVLTANNGLTKQANNNVVLGGALTGNTLISGAYTLSLCNGALLNTQCGYQISGCTILQTDKGLSVLIGPKAGNLLSTGNANINIGICTSVALNVGCNNIAIGCQAFNAAINSCCEIAIGVQALLNACCRNSDIAIGTCALYKAASGVGCSIAIGYKAGFCSINGVRNVMIGYCAGYLELNSDKLYIANSGTITPLIYGDFNTSAVTLNAKLTLGVVPTTGALTDVVLVRNSGGEVRTVTVATITGATAISAINGLTKTGNQIKLGGTLTGITTINGGQTLNINQTVLNLSGNTSVNITGTAVTLQTTPPAGLTSDAVLVWNSGDKKIKTVSGAALGDKNNIYSHSAVTTSVLLTTGSSYVILVNNSAPVTITLPATPINGQVFKIKNVSGTAVTNIITVAGNGKNIDGSASGLINTDYGALELIYDTTLTAWYTLAFIN